MNFDRFSALPEYAFPRLAELIDGVEPGKPMIDFSIGEPKHDAPDFVRAALDKHWRDYRRYPPTLGTEGWREAVYEWAARRYGWKTDRLTAEAGVIPLNGTREGLFMAALAVIPTRRAQAGPPAALLPNPFYQCYAAAAIAVGATPEYLHATEETGWLPSLDQPEELWRRAAAFFICSPSNPQGAVATPDYWRRLLALAEQHDFMIFADECYSEIYRESVLGAAPTGILAEARETGASLDRVLAFHSLSKRSNLAGLRSGFVMGGTAPVEAVRRLKAYAGAPNPIPALHAAEAAWRDEAHVAENRARYEEKFRIADELLTIHPAYRSPAAGFFLWLRVGDGEAAAKALWREEGVKGLPGAYLSRRGGDGFDPGASYLRIALVEADAGRVEEGLTRVGAFLARNGAAS